MTFEYSALHATTSKRLLKVLPGCGDGVHVVLYEETRATPYRCLSYTWGALTPSCQHHVNGHTMEVGKNLHDFLVVASTRLVKEPIWIDAICINQQDDQEKSVQVQRMGIIFRGAFEVIIWLGNDAGVADLFDWINRWQRKMLQPKPPPHLFEAAKRCAVHPYWTRVWILQEVFLARSLSLLCGPSEVHPDDFKRYMDRDRDSLWRKTNLLSESTKAQSLARCKLDEDESYLRIRQFFREIQDLKSGTSLDFWATFEHLAYNAKCFDPRDKIYSVLAITGEDSSFHVDYAESFVDTFRRSADHFYAWPDPGRVYKLWDVARLTKEMVLEADKKGQHLRCEIPVCRTKLMPRLRSAVYGNLRYCCRESDSLRHIEIPGCRADDILLCSHPHHYYTNPHFLLRQCKSDITGHFEILVSLEGNPQISLANLSDTELWHVSNGKMERVTHWDDLLHKSKLQSEPIEDWMSKPHFLLNLGQDYLFFCIDSLSRELVSHV